MNTLRQLMRSYRQVVQSHAKACKRDMDYILRYIGISILRNDTQEFADLVVWMENITRALKKEDSSLKAYQALQHIIRTTMALEMVQLIDPYLDKLINALAVDNKFSVG